MSSIRKAIWRCDEAGALRACEDDLAAEEPLEIMVETRSVSITMRTPGHDEELAAGFLLTEGLVHSRENIREIRAYPRNQHGNAVNVFLEEGHAVDYAKLTRHVFASSSCGICGKASIESIQKQFPPLERAPDLDARILPGLPDRMREAQGGFDRTGGLHAAALFSREGKLEALREDVGRHNAVDKLVGWSLLSGFRGLADSLLMVSGRVSFEIVQKAFAARIPMIAAISAPSSLAADFAQANRQILVGFLRGNTFNVYAGADRVRPRELPAHGH